MASSKTVLSIFFKEWKKKGVVKLLKEAVFKLLKGNFKQ